MSTPEKTEKSNIPDAEVVAEEKHDIKPKVEVVTVLREGEDAVGGPDGGTSENASAEQPAVRIRVETRSRHRLMIKCFEMDDDGIIDIIISDADVN